MPGLATQDDRRAAGRVMTGLAEVLIVGAGPAGAALGLELARRGRDVLILEGTRFPRDKPCGDCLNPGAVRELRRLGVAERLQTALAPVPLGGWRVEAPDGRGFSASFAGNGDRTAIQGWAVRRREFDAALLDEAVRAGARIRFGVRAFDLFWDEGRVAGVLARTGTRAARFSSRFVVGADGLRSVVMRRLGLSGRLPRLRKVALVGHLCDSNGGGPAASGADTCLGELRVRSGRCCGYAALRQGANLTLVVPARQASLIAGRPREFLLSALCDFPPLLERVRRDDLERAVAVTGPFDQPVRQMWAPGALLVGDAAGYYDPFTGQGIHQALKSAALAAEAVDLALRHPAAEPLFLRSYAARMRRELAPKRAVQRLIEAVVSRPRAMSRFVRALAEEPVVARRLLRVTGDLAHPLTLLDPLLLGRLMVGLAQEGE